jgi:mannose-6-phosphate isomerase-like protein (cupin superfamily)
MKRRTFLTVPLVASALVSAAQKQQDGRPKKGFKVEKGKGRTLKGVEINYGSFDCKVSGKDTDGQLCIFDTMRKSQTGPPLHYHHQQDEWFYVIKGEFKVQIGDETFILKEGDSAFAPRKVPHAFIKTCKEDAQLMVLFQPAGTMEDFFKDRALVDKETDAAKKELALKGLWDKHGMKVVGPALSL